MPLLYYVDCTCMLLYDCCASMLLYIYNGYILCACIYYVEVQGDTRNLESRLATYLMLGKLKTATIELVYVESADFYWL